MSDWRDEVGKQREPDEFEDRRKVLVEQLGQAEFRAHHDRIMSLVGLTSTALDIRHEYSDKSA